MNNEISNKKIEVPKGMNLNDKDYLNDLLSSLKCLVKDYTVSLTEASNKNLYQEYKEMYNELSMLQRETYELLFKYGWYQLEQAEDEKINNKCQKLVQELESLNE